LVAVSIFLLIFIAKECVRDMKQYQVLGIRDKVSIRWSKKKKPGPKAAMIG
jgi:hypothetical protein